MVYIDNILIIIYVIRTDRGDENSPVLSMNWQITITTVITE